MKNVVIVVDEKKCKEIEKFYSIYEKENKNEYILFFAKKEGLTVSIFDNKKGQQFKALFTGEYALIEAKKWDKNASEVKKEKKTINKSNWLCLDDQIGSDEVGTGDFVGPIVVCAAYVKQSDISLLKQIGVDDSKRLKDEDILRVGKTLLENIDYSILRLENEKYNSLIDEGKNINEIKAIMHNKGLLNMKNKHHVKNIFVDEFVGEEKYYDYLVKQDEILKGITFKTKGETYYPSVAAASIIARYIFLKTMDELKEKYGVEIPFGASKKVDVFVKNIYKIYGENEAKKIVKKNFANYSEIFK